MALSTVTVSMKGVFQNEQPFTGFAHFKLSRIALSDDTIVAPKEGHRVPFKSDGESSICLIPNSLLGDDTYYEFEIIRKSPSGMVMKSETVLSGRCVVPNHDCNLSDIVDVETDKTETLPSAKLYASEAKAAARRVENLYTDLNTRVYIAYTQEQRAHLVEGGLYININGDANG